MRILATLSTVAFLFGCGAALADPVGTYDCEGTNPGSGSGYKCSVVVERTGDTYRVTWQVGGDRYVGTGIGNKDFIAVSYRSGNNTGLALYGPDGDNWLGVWTYADGRQIGAEHWTRR
jgi:hypothetical protein